MKKVVLMVAVVCATVLASCSSKTCYKCTGASVPALNNVEYCDDVVTEQAMSIAKSGCETADGTWSKN